MATWKQWLGRRFGLADGGAWGAYYGVPNASGQTVTDTTALNVAAAWACVKTSAEAIGNLPLSLYRLEADGSRVLERDHPVAAVIANPNADMTATEFWSAVTAWLLTRGNSYAMIERIGGRIVGLNLLPSDTVTVVRDADWRLRYRFTYQNQSYDLGPENILHIKGFGFGGDTGLSPIAFGAQALGSALAADETAAATLANGLMPSGILSTEQEIADEQREQLTKLLKAYTSSKNAGKLMVLESGLKFDKISFDPTDLQLLESRRFSVEEVCRLFGTPPVVIGHAGDGVTAWGSGIESIYLQWLQTGLDPLMSRIESRIIKSLMSPAERTRYLADFSRGQLIRTDSAARASYLSTLTQNGLMTRNEGRRELHLPPMPGGDSLTAQTNLAPLEKLGQTTGGQNVQNS